MLVGGSKYRSDLQGLRAVAVSLVVLAHANVPGFAGGFVGVDVFFVLSGFLITGILVEERSTSGTIAYGRFLARRLRRLLPAMLAVLLTTIVVASIVLTAYEMQIQSGSFPFALTWISNFYFAFSERNYFSALQSEDLFLHTWSLGVEEQFYLLWPWLILVLFGLRNKKNGHSSTRVLFLTSLAVVFFASLALSFYLSVTHPILSFYMMPPRAWQFALGSAVYVAFLYNRKDYDTRSGKGSGKLTALSLGILGLLLIFGSATLLGPDIKYPGYFALFPSIGAAFIIAAGASSAAQTSNAVLQLRPLVWLGDRSYSVYLWHWPVFVLGNSLHISATSVGVFALVGIVLLLAAASYRFLELPFWKGRLSRGIPRRVVLISVLAMLTSLGVGKLLENTIYGVYGPVPIDVAQRPRQDMYSEIYGDSKLCDSNNASAELVPCRIGGSQSSGGVENDGDRGSVVVVIGDSIGAQWSSMVAGVFSAPQWSVIVLTKSACAIVDVSYYYYAVGGDYDVCTEWRENALQYAAAIRPDVIIIGSSATYDFTENDWVDGSSRIFSRLSAVAGQVIVIPGTPALSFDGPSCLEDPARFSFRLLDGHRECEELQSSSVSVEVTGYLNRAADAFSNVVVLDLANLVCPNQRCAARSEAGIAVFRDRDHLTNSFVISTIAEVRQLLSEIGVDLDID